LSADFALVLTIATIVIVKIVVSGTTKRTEGIFWNGFTVTMPYRFKLCLVLPFIVGKKKQPVLLNERLNDRKFISLKLLIFRRVNFIVSPLAKRYVF